eukprot:6188587-Pleurochrysis_carterae.AAC.1
MDAYIVASVRAHARALLRVKVCEGVRGRACECAGVRVCAYASRAVDPQRLEEQRDLYVRMSPRVRAHVIVRACWLTHTCLHACLRARAGHGEGSYARVDKAACMCARVCVLVCVRASECSCVRARAPVRVRVAFMRENAVEHICECISTCAHVCVIHAYALA